MNGSSSSSSECFYECFANFILKCKKRRDDFVDLNTNFHIFLFPCFVGLVAQWSVPLDCNTNIYKPHTKGKQTKKH